LEDVRSNASVERLAASPLLLTMLALLRRHVGKLPGRRIELYERYIRTLIDNWHTVRSPGARQQAPERFDPHTAIAYLIELAFWLQQHKPSGTARRQELEQVLETICLRFEGHDPAAASPKARVQAQQTAARFLQDMRHFAGLLPNVAATLSAFCISLSRNTFAVGHWLVWSRTNAGPLSNRTCTARAGASRSRCVPASWEWLSSTETG
jgi:hypothetical protein